MTAPLLVVAHEATRTGSPRVLVELLRYAVPRLGAPVAVRLLAGGPLAGELTALATAPDSIATPRAVLVNGALGAPELERFDPSVPAAVYVHEEGEALEVLAEAASRVLVERASRVLCVSDRSRAGLLAMGVPADRIVVLPPVVVARSSPSAVEVADARSRLGASPEDRLFVACGEAGWRKGADLFLQVAGGVAAGEAGELARFAWIGRRGRSFGRVLDHDVRMLHLDYRMRWLGEVDDPSALLAAADVLVMTSREDPQPLVPLEAAMAGTPTVGFGRGGLVDFAADGAAAVAPYPDTAALARLASAVAADEARGAALVAAAVERVRSRQDISVVGPLFEGEMRALLGRGSPS